MEGKIISPCEFLSGWHWVDYDDGSGHLESPKKEKFFSYDIMPYYIEYEITLNSDYDVFRLPLKEFKRHAEHYIIGKGWM